MSRQINLLNPALIRQHNDLNAWLLFRLSAGMLLLLLCLVAYARYQVNVLAKQRDQVAQQLKDAQVQLTQAAQRYAPRQPSKALQDTIALTEARLLSHQQVLEYLQEGKLAGHAGFSIYMSAFARKSIGNLWLTGFSIDQDANDMTLHGRALQPELVPQYISQLGEDPSLKGRKFSALNMRLPMDEPVARPASTVAPLSGAVPSLQFIEFELKSSSHQDGKPDVGGSKS